MRDCGRFCGARRIFTLRAAYVAVHVLYVHTTRLSNLYRSAVTILGSCRRKYITLLVHSYLVPVSFCYM